jgi:hypothetical protein
MRMFLSSSISTYFCLPLPVVTVQFCTEAHLCGDAVKATLCGVIKMIGVDWLPYHASHAFDDVSTPVFDRALVIVIPSHILESV